jgi:hypothetical protein
MRGERMSQMTQLALVLVRFDGTTEATGEPFNLMQERERERKRERIAKGIKSIEN